MARRISAESLGQSPTTRASSGSKSELEVQPLRHFYRSSDWLFRLLFAFTGCLQPLQIFPMIGSCEIV
jgi:hypothetical protein